MNFPLITVFGATGQQGGGMARALLAQQRWRVRAVTRQPQSEAARTLSVLGAELCCADLDQPDTTYAYNLRLHFSRLTEQQWRQQARTLQARPPMPWFALRDMNDADLKAIGAPGPVPAQGVIGQPVLLWCLARTGAVTSGVAVVAAGGLHQRPRSMCARLWQRPGRRLVPPFDQSYPDHL